MNEDRFRIGTQEIILLALAVVAVVLAVFALRPAAPPSVDAGTTGASSGDPTNAAQEEPTGTPEAERPAALVGGVNAGAVLVRATGGPCDGAEAPLTIATTGADETVVADVDDVVTATGVLVVSGQEARVIAADADCAPVGLTTADGGTTWQATDGLPRFWSVLPGRGQTVQSPAGEVDTPCEAVRASGIDAGVARLWCADGKILGTNTAGEEWATLGSTTSAVDVAFTSAESGYALVERDDCAGISVDRTTNGGSSWSTVYCVEGEGPWALASTRDRVAVVGVETTWTSTDGEDWEQL